MALTIVIIVAIIGPIAVLILLKVYLAKRKKNGKSFYFYVVKKLTITIIIKITFVRLYVINRGSVETN